MDCDEIEAEEVIEETYEENINELNDAEMMVGAEAEKELPAVDVTEEDVKDDLKEYLFRSAAREQYNQFVEGLRKKGVVDIRADFSKPS